MEGEDTVGEEATFTIEKRFDFENHLDRTVCARSLLEDPEYRARFLEDPESVRRQARETLKETGLMNEGSDAPRAARPGREVATFTIGTTYQFEKNFDRSVSAREMLIRLREIFGEDEGE